MPLRTVEQYKKMFNPLYCWNFTHPQKTISVKSGYWMEPHIPGFQGSVKEMTSVFGFAIYYYCNANIVTK
jgi:hypothetical protein